jgi:hypothetical protein
MKKKSILLSLVTIPFLVACGGGSTTTSSVSQSAKITGTVPGTKIEAFCDNSVHKEIKSINDGTAKHPFTLVIPKDTNCRIVMTTNEDSAQDVVITHLKFEDDKGNQSIIINVSGDEIDLGHTNLPMSIADIDDANNDHVKDTPLITPLPPSNVSTVIQENDPLDSDNDDIINLYEDDDDDKIPNIKDDDYNHDDDDDDDDDDDKDHDDDDDDHNNDHDNNNTNDIPITLPSSYTPNAGQLLGSQCAQCHGTNGVSVNKWDSIAGEDNLHSEMFEKGINHIMTAQALGYTSEEISLMEAWLQTLSKSKN